MNLWTSRAAAGFLAVLLATAFAITEGPHFDPKEPWAGYWWPQYCDGDTSCHRNHRHLWLGSLSSGDYDGPIFNHDTRYFWLPEPRRDSAKNWEYAHHRTTDSSGGTSNDGHCNGLAASSILEDEPPDDCGALSQSDLKGLLTELYYNLGVYQLTPRFPTPAQIWSACRFVLWSDLAGPNSFMLDFDRDTSDVATNQVNWFAVYGYKVDYWAGSQPGIVDGTLSVYYEQHYSSPGLTGNRPGSVKHSFIGVLVTDTLFGGTWSNLATAPDYALLPMERYQGDTNINPHINYDTLKRVIDHKTIILDDAYADSAYPCLPPGQSWVRRPGYADSCWAVLTTDRTMMYYSVWFPRLGCDGMWSLYAYKTPPVPGESLTDYLNVLAKPSGWWWFDQSAPPFDTWRLLDSRYLTQEMLGHVDVTSVGSGPWPCYTYFDALKLEYVGGGKDGGASSSTMALGDVSQRVRVIPNPVGRTARISYVVPAQGRVDVAIYDVTGRAVLKAPQGTQRPGVQTANISVAGLPTGTYMARVSANGVNSTCRFVVCR